MTPRERLEAKTERRPDGCWIWTGGCDSSGYGAIKVDGRKVGTHRASYELHVGPIPEGLQIDHLCRVTRCLNPDHLEAVTPRVNTLRSEGIAAREAAQTHCKRGHEFTPENTYTGGTPAGRRCRTCRRDQGIARRAGAS